MEEKPLLQSKRSSPSKSWQWEDDGFIGFRVVQLWKERWMLCVDNWEIFRSFDLSTQLLCLMTFACCFSFYFYCVYTTFAPQQLNVARRLVDSGCTGKSAMVGAGTGAVLGATLVAASFLAIGLSPIGPIAGGLFASSMGSGLAAGGGMATLQSLAMTGTAYGTGAAVGAATGTAVAC